MHSTTPLAPQEHDRFGIRTVLMWTVAAALFFAVLRWLSPWAAGFVGWVAVMIAVHIVGTACGRRNASNSAVGDVSPKGGSQNQGSRSYNSPIALDSGLPSDPPQADEAPKASSPSSGYSAIVAEDERAGVSETQADKKVDPSLRTGVGLGAGGGLLIGQLVGGLAQLARDEISTAVVTTLSLGVIGALAGYLVTGFLCVMCLYFRSALAD